MSWHPRFDDPDKPVSATFRLARMAVWLIIIGIVGLWLVG